MSPLPAFRGTMLGKAAALALLIIALTLVILPAVAFFRSINADYETRVSALAGEIATLQRIAALRSGQSGELAALDRDSSIEMLLRQETTPALAIARMQAELRNAASEAGATVLSTQGVSDAGAEPLTRLTASITFEADIAAIARFLHRVESHRPLFSIDTLTITDPDGDALREVAGANRLRVDLQVRSLVRGGA